MHVCSYASYVDHPMIVTIVALCSYTYSSKIVKNRISATTYYVATVARYCDYCKSFIGIIATVNETY